MEATAARTSGALSVERLEFHGRKVWTVRHSRSPEVWVGEDVGECLLACMRDLARFGFETVEIEHGSAPWEFSEGFRRSLRERRKAAGLGPGDFLPEGALASRLTDFEDGEGELPLQTVSAVLAKVERAELAKGFELPPKVSYSDRLAGLD